MSAHPRLAEYLCVAYGCMACDGDIAPAEVSCLRSIAVQMGQPAEEVEATLASIRIAFADDPVGTVGQAMEELRESSLSHDDAVLLLDILVQLVEADGTIHHREADFIRDLVQRLALNRAALRRTHPEWRTYLVEGFGVVREVRPSYSGRLADTIGDLPDLAPKRLRE